eukprot:1569157-Pyramimonas_sp.AAC.1
MYTRAVRTYLAVSINERRRNISCIANNRERTFAICKAKRGDNEEGTHVYSRVNENPCHGSRALEQRLSGVKACSANITVFCSSKLNIGLGSA